MHHRHHLRTARTAEAPASANKAKEAGTAEPAAKAISRRTLNPASKDKRAATEPRIIRPAYSIPEAPRISSASGCVTVEQLSKANHFEEVQRPEVFVILGAASSRCANTCATRDWYWTRARNALCLESGCRNAADSENKCYHRFNVL